MSLEGINEVKEVKEIDFNKEEKGKRDITSKELAKLIERDLEKLNSVSDPNQNDDSLEGVIEDLNSALARIEANRES